jgi:hypothetical protein
MRSAPVGFTMIAVLLLWASVGCGSRSGATDGPERLPPGTAIPTSKPTTSESASATSPSPAARPTASSPAAASHARIVTTDSSSSRPDVMISHCPLDVAFVQSLFHRPMRPESGGGTSAAVQHETLSGVTSQWCTYVSPDPGVQIGLRLEFRLGESARRSWSIIGSGYPSAMFKRAASPLGEVFRTVDGPTAQESSLIVHQAGALAFVTATGYGESLKPGVITQRADQAALALIRALQI